MMAGGKNIRAFLAIEPPDDILSAVIGLQEKLRRVIKGKIAWTRAGSQHITLKFFGDVPTEDIDAIGRSVQNRLQAGWSVNLKIAGLGLFPDARKPRVLWCAAAGDVAKLAALQKQLDNDFAPLGFAPETRPFRPHLTLARIREPQTVRGLNEALEGQADFFTGQFNVHELILFQSRLRPEGAVYTKLAAFPLEPAGYSGK